MKLTKIWNDQLNAKDSYVDFQSTFLYDGNGKVKLNVSCDSIFEAKINGQTVGFGNCSNFPKHKQFFSFDCTKFLDKKNTLTITVWHMGIDTQTYINKDAFLMYNVVQGKAVLVESNKDTLCRVNPNFESGLCKMMTAQLGYSFRYDLTAKDGETYRNSIEYGLDKCEKTGIKNLKLLKRIDPRIIETENGIIIDMKKETVGYIDLDIDCEKDTELLISYGEKLVDGHVTRIIDARDFSVEVMLGKGNNKYVNLFRRLAGRYLEIYTDKVKINYLGIRPVEYPVSKIINRYDDKTLQKINDVCTYTLKCCMHEHYEDCPWREQALYCLDSRNQMLCGYYAFKTSEFQKANLLLIAKGLLKNGLLNICFPSGSVIPIPMFSLVYPIQVAEYIEHTGDKAILNKVGKVIKSIMSTFEKRIDENGLIANLPYPFWNFYEWNDYSANDNEITRKKSDKYKIQYDLILNCMYIYAKKFYDKLFGTVTDFTAIKKAIKDTFYVKENGLYKLSTKCDKCSVLGNSMAILAGIGDKALADKLVKNDCDLVPITLSMNTFYYDALMTFGDEYNSYIIDDIKKKYGKMLKAGASTVWETELGWKDFNGAGSLCHGWSAMPVYYLKKLIK